MVWLRSTTGCKKYSGEHTTQLSSLVNTQRKHCFHQAFTGIKQLQLTKNSLISLNRTKKITIASGCHIRQDLEGSSKLSFYIAAVNGLAQETESSQPGVSHMGLCKYEGECVNNDDTYVLNLVTVINLESVKLDYIFDLT